MRRTTLLLAGAALLGGCSGEPITTESTARIQPQTVAPSRALPAENQPFGSGDKPAPDVNKDLAALRRVTARFHTFSNATAAGWSAQITGCMVDPGGAGGMGFHYGNPSLIDGTARVEEPELLLYEPESNGRLRLVAVEYIIPYTAHARDAAPPRLFNRDFKQVDAFQLWGLHAWVWENNPSGVFADWNPRVTCRNATSVSIMSH